MAGFSRVTAVAYVAFVHTEDWKNICTYTCYITLPCATELNLMVLDFWLIWLKLWGLFKFIRFDRCNQITLCSDYGLVTIL